MNQMFMKTLDRLTPCSTKPNHFHSACKFVPKDLKQHSWNDSSLEHKDNDNEIPMIPAADCILQLPSMNTYEFDTSTTEWSHLKQGYLNAACLDNMITFVATLFLTPAVSKVMQQQDDNKEQFLACLQKMYDEMMWTNRPLQIDVLLDTIRLENEPKWKYIDVKSQYSLTEIINFILNKAHNETCKINDNAVEPTKPQAKDKNSQLYQMYFNYLVGIQGHSTFGDIFNIQMIFDNTCLKCRTSSRHLKLCWQYKVPINIHWLRFWHTDADGNTTATFVFMNSQSLVDKPLVQDCFKQIVQEIEGDDDDMDVDIVNHCFIKIEGQIKYGIFVAYLLKNVNGWVWTARDWFDVLDGTIEYNQQCRYSLVFQEICPNTDINQQYYFDIQQYLNVKTKKCIPKSYPQMSWNKNNSAISIEEVKEFTEEHKSCLYPPDGDRILGLFEQLEVTSTQGYLEYLFCEKCNEIQATNVLPTIWKIQNMGLINLIQNPQHHYKFQWDPSKSIHGLRINPQQILNVQINGYMTRNTNNKYGTHFKMISKTTIKNKGKKTRKNTPKVNAKIEEKTTWYRMINTKFHSNHEPMNCDNICLLLVSKVNFTQ